MRNESSYTKLNEKGVTLFMKKRSLSFCLAVGMFLTLASPTGAQAATLEEIKAQQESKANEIEQLDQQMNSKLTEINEKNNELEAIQEEITGLEATIEETAADIKAQEEVVSKRLEQAKERLQTIQTTEVNQNTVLSLIEAESVTDFLNRAYVLVTLQTAGNDQIEVAQEEADELAALEEQQEADKSALEEKSVAAQEHKEELDTELANLQKTMDDNKALLDKLDKERADEENRLAAEKEAAEKAAAEKAAKEAEAAKQAATKTAAKTESTPVATQVETEKTEKQPVPSEPKQTAQPKAEEKASAKTETTSSSSKTIVVSATGYSTQEAGLSTHTATGIDLTKNPNVIAVDPSVIPLGSMVEIPGVGTFIAGDTGGAINGNKIDIHFSTVQQANNWGRRTVTVKILN